MLRLVKSARMVITDSGGIQEETTYLGVPCLTMRENTERPSTIALGTNTLVGSDRAKLLRAVDEVMAGSMKKGADPAALGREGGRSNRGRHPVRDVGAFRLTGSGIGQEGVLRNKRLWVAWERQRRSLELAPAFGCQLAVIDLHGVPRTLRPFAGPDARARAQTAAFRALRAEPLDGARGPWRAPSGRCSAYPSWWTGTPRS